jgi:hypothetical protein
MPKKLQKLVHPLTKPATRRMEQGSAAMTVLNRIKSGKKVPDWAVKSAGIQRRKK